MCSCEPHQLFEVFFVRSTLLLARWLPELWRFLCELHIHICDRNISKHGQKYDQLFVIVKEPDSRRRRLGNVLMFPLNQVNQLALGVKNTLRWNLVSHIYSLLGQPSCPDFRLRYFPIFRSVSVENSIFCPQAFAAWLARRDKLLKPFDHPVRNSVYDETE